ncbi:MAG: PEPxxWA-CTERM sorting domain-containing protein [Pseudomonadota bacterium]|mgnify:FL=1
MRNFSVIVVAGVAAFSGGTARAAFLLTTPTYFENFDTLANIGNSNILPGGFELAEEGSNNNNTYGTGTGSSNAGNTYSFGANGSVERALGGLRSGALIPTFGIQFTNLLGRTITALNLSFLGEQYRLGTAGRADRLSFEYSTTATSLLGTGYIPLTALDFSSPTTTGPLGVLDGNAAANQRNVSGTIAGLELLAGQSIFLRFRDFDAAGADDGLAIDNFRAEAVTLGAVPEPSTWMMLIAGFGFIGAALRGRRIKGKSVLA